jgi:L-lactate dehydrogenase complex protein LldF
MHALENLGAYLEQFEARCTAAGGTVHWAADAAEARQIILDILRQENATEVIKIKTMTSAEIQLNPFLEAAGVNAYETDLAEIILQLGEESPRTSSFPRCTSIAARCARSSPAAWASKISPTTRRP